MITSKGSPRRCQAHLTLPLLLVALIQTAAAQTTAPTEPSATVVVNGVRSVSGQANNVVAAKSKVMSRNRASSCNYMSEHKAAEDDVALNYMSDFGMEGSWSNDAEHFSDLSPAGDVSNAPISSSLDGMNDTGADSLSTPSVGCGPGDRRFAAGRNRIESKDTTLALGFEAFDNKNYPKAFELFATAYNKIGYEEASLMLAKMHLYGLGTPKDSNQAIKWLRQVTDARFDPMRDRMKFDPKDPHMMNERVEATFMLARMYERGIGTEKNPSEAKKWYAKAAEFGFVPALNILGQAWLSGYGGDKNISKAIAYFKEATEAGYVPSAYNLGKMYYTGDDGVPHDLKLAGAYFNVAAKAGHPGALFAAGRMYDLGEGVAADPSKAVVYYKEAAVKGNRDAEFALGTFFYNGEVVAKDLETARKLFDAAAKQGQVDAMFNLGAMISNGEGGPKDMALAYVWFSLAKQAGHQSADQVLRAVTPRLSAGERAKADAILKPERKS
ncbi:tetratricopeptide repeat protein [Massilia horti]|uniref:Sel1 repeat family protein n=1 Tax=Massilia horti TaxID=2562153 RepID=A0A4Y9T4L7_9BURK|nr:SEL1-like repeat protein [Massilia horti]TFW34650.1 hypothetical protein E4O92_03570 [Massilia horti]